MVYLFSHVRFRSTVGALMLSTNDFFQCSLWMYFYSENVVGLTACFILFILFFFNIFSFSFVKLPLYSFSLARDNKANLQYKLHEKSWTWIMALLATSKLAESHALGCH